MAERVAPPIPATCSRLDITGDGLAIPIVQVRLADGGVDFRARHNAVWRACWLDRLCQLCGNRLEHPIVLLCTADRLLNLTFDEAPLHPACAFYTAQACPMVAGRQARYSVGPSISERGRGRTCYLAGCDCGGWVTHDNRDGIAGTPARPWFAVYASDYLFTATPEGELSGGMCRPEHVLRVRRVSTPGAPCTPWEPVTDWLDRYTAPTPAEQLPAPEVAPWAKS